MIVPVGSRLIDNVDTIRTRPMKVLALGMSRTGTSSLRDALIVLDFKPFHFREVMMDWRHSIPLWTEALEAKYFNKTVPYGRPEFDRLIGDFDAVEDNPSILFADELITAYPDAKVILTNRNVDEWIESMEKTVFKIEQSSLYKYLHRLHPLPRAWFTFVTLQAKIWYKNNYDRAKLKALYAEHYEHIRAIVPKENLLELELGSGWDPLCKFLDVPVPSVPYPHSNDTETFQNRQRYIKRMLVAALIAVLIMIAAIVLVLLQACRMYGRDPDVMAILTFLATISVAIVATIAITQPGSVGTFYHGMAPNGRRAGEKKRKN